MNLAEQLLKALQGYGVKEIFGIPGDFALPLDRLDYAALANNQGGRGHSACTKKELHTALEQAFEYDTCFQLIDTSLARGLMSNTLSRFVAGSRQMRGP